MAYPFKPHDPLASITEWLLSASAEVGAEYFQLPVQWTDDCHYSLGGEVDKSRHPIIRGNAKPDFLVHVPGRMDNLLVVEVKPGNAAVARMTDDLMKLLAFRRKPANYVAAYFLVYGASIAKWPALRKQLLSVAGANFDPSLVTCFIHEEPRARAQAVSWAP